MNTGPSVVTIDLDAFGNADIFRVEEGRVVEHWDVLQEEVPAADKPAATPCSLGLRELCLFEVWLTLAHEQQTSSAMAKNCPSSRSC
jgi:hypothetical protein